MNQARKLEDGHSKCYKSPQRKLVSFFERSRDQWKAKCIETKSMLKRLKNRVRFLEKSKEYWKSRVKELEQELAELRTQERVREQECVSVKKN